MQAARVTERNVRRALMSAPRLTDQPSFANHAASCNTAASRANLPGGDGETCASANG